MPEHLHLLTYPTDEMPDFGKYLARIKQPFSKLIKEILVKNRSQLVEQLTVQERPGKSCFRFWQEGAGYDRNLFSKAAIIHSIGYLHENPHDVDCAEKLSTHRVLSIEPALALAKPVAPSECMFDSATQPDHLEIRYSRTGMNHVTGLTGIQSGSGVRNRRSISTTISESSPSYASASKEIRRPAASKRKRAKASASMAYSPPEQP